VSYRGSDPQKVALVANTLASSYIEEDLKTRERQAGGTAEFLQSQLEEMKRKLDAQEKEVSNYKEKHMGELPEQRDGNLATLESLNSQLLLNSEKQIRARESKAIIERQLAAAENPESSSRPDAKIAKIAKLNQELAELKRTYSDKYPDVIRTQQEIARLQKQLNDPAPAAPEQGELASLDPYVLQLQQALKGAEAELRVLASEEANLHKSIALYQARVENAPRREQEFQELSRDYRTTQDVYSSLLKRYEESKLAESMEHRQKGEQFRVLDPAITPEKPYAPNRPRLLLFALVLSAGLAAGLVALAETFDTSFHGLDDLRAFSKVPVLASIPLIVTPSDRRGARRRAQAAVISCVLLLGVVLGASYAIAHGNEWLVGLISGAGR
jgi:polysaccharide chain length determinant protein (PEP-CTERM system associated)